MPSLVAATTVLTRDSLLQKNALTTAEIVEALGLPELKNRKWHVQGSIATRCASCPYASGVKCCAPEQWRVVLCSHTYHVAH